jgi:hypothetical protein
LTSDRAREIQSLMSRWRKKTKSAMPLDIASMPIEKIRVAVTHIEKGDIVVVPKGLSLGDTRQAMQFGEDSMMEDDQHGRY